MPDIRRQVIRAVERHAMVEPWEPLVLAVSGGADSVALAKVLTELNGKEIPPFHAHIAHLDHGIRGREAEQDAEFVRKLADELGVEFHLERVPVPQMAQELSIGVEEAGRLARYDFFRRIAEQIGGRRVATAHHADDNVETVLMRVARGMTYRALAGIPPARPIAADSEIRVVRPLINSRRKDIEHYLEQTGQAFRRDATNFRLDNLRNRIRHKVIPRMENRMLPGVSESILKSIRAFRRSRRGLTVQALGLIESGPARMEARRVRFPARWLSSMSHILASEVVHQMLARLVPRTDALTIAHHQAVLDLACSGRTTGETHLPGGLVARREYDRVDILAREYPDPVGETAVPLENGEVECPEFQGRLIVLLRDEGARALAGFLTRRRPNTALLDADRLQGPVTLRPWRAGDRMRPLGAPGEKKLQDIFTDRKVPRSERRRIPVLSAGGEPVWIVGHVIAEGVRVGPATTRAVELVFAKG